MPALKDYYVIFRPETGVWSLTLPLSYREKVIGEGMTSDQATAYTKKTTRGLLDRGSVKIARQKMCQQVCEKLELQYIAPSEEQEKASYVELLKYINDTIASDEWDEDAGFAPFLDSFDL